MADPQKMVKPSQLARIYLGGLTHVHTVLSNHPTHHESNLSVDRIARTLRRAKLAGRGLPLRYVLFNEHPSDPSAPRLLGRFSTRGRRLLRVRRRKVVEGIPMLYGLEVSILPNGTTDLTPRLADHQCALVIASRHYLPEATEHHPETIAELFATACDNPQVDVLGHPPRYIENEPGVDWAGIFAYAARTGTAIEINLNAFPTPKDDPIQLAFWPKWLKTLADSQAPIFIGTDIHNQLQLETFIAQWHGLDESAGRDENHLARFLLAMQAAGIPPERIISTGRRRLLSWLAIDKAGRAKLCLSNMKGHR